MTNRLAGSLSPYLRQHADNPVDWREWGPEALAEARSRNVPIFLSIGYAACHWCHVMARESFSDPEVAALVNATSVPIKVDREERPDLDAVYMAATIGLTGQGGWPMSVWLTPDGAPFHAGTYFPPEPRHGMPSFRQVVAAAAQAWRDRPEEVRAGAADIAAQLARRTGPPPAGTVDADDIDAAVLLLASDYDEVHSGFGGAPKFPPAMVLDALLARAAQDDGAVADRAWQMARDTCRAMADGGIHDQLAGGFARYSTDRAWIVPHFEKMLYDNGLLLSTYTRAALEAERRGESGERFAEVAAGIVDWLGGELRTDEGSFASSLDADSDDEHGHHSEGAFYVWTPEQVSAVAPELAAAYRVSAEGTFEHGTSVLQRDPAVPVTDEQRLRLLAVRNGRPRPARDDKVVAAWNGWAVASVAEAAMVQDRPDWLDLAVGAASAVLARQLDATTGRLARTSCDGVVSAAPGTAEDHAAMAHGCAVLAAATGERRWLDHAIALLQQLEEHFLADDGGLYDSADDAETLYLRPREVAENATPSATSAAVRAARLVARLTGDAHWVGRADTWARTMGALVTQAPRAAGWALHDAITELGRRPAAEIAIVGAEDPADPATHDPATHDLVRLAWRLGPPGSVVTTGRDIPVLEGRTAINGRPTAYVCHGQVCDLPVSDLSGLAAQLVR